jgi:hypothetical protein
MVEIPLKAIPSQVVNVSLNQQNCDISVYQKTTGLYFDLTIGNERIVTGVLARDAVNLVQQASKGFNGAIGFIDTIGSSDPEYTGLGSRYALLYTEA